MSTPLDADFSETELDPDESPPRGGFAWITNLAGCVLVIAMLVNVLLDVTLRYLLNQPIRGTIELVASWWMAPLSFVSIAIAAWSGDHVRMTMLLDRTAGRTTKLLDAIALGLFTVVIALIGWYGYVSARVHQQQGETGMASGLALWPFRWVVPIACLFAIAFSWRAYAAHRQSRTDGAL